MKILNGRATLIDAAKFWLEHHPDGSTVTLGDLVDQYVEALG